jgi:sodium-dependent dicarboxylate transporter 2/3/5
MAEPATPQDQRADLGGPGVRLGAVIGGVFTFFVLLILPPPAGMEPVAWRVAAIAALMAIWWIFGAAPVAVTALLPVLLFPLLGIASARETTAPYGNPLIFLFMGGFMIALAVERWNLHRRIALNILRVFGAHPDRLIGGFMVATAALSMWVSNTATTIMMLPVALSVVALIRNTGETVSTPTEDRHFTPGLLLGTAYAATIGGMATLVGTPPNALLAGYMTEVHDRTIGFAEWMLVGLPLSLILLPITWYILTHVIHPTGHVEIPGARKVISGEIEKLGPISRQEISVAIVFGITALSWIARPYLNALIPGSPLSDAGIAIAGAILLFLIPADFSKGAFLLNWDWAKRVPWDILILFGGGLTLAAAINSSGLAAWIGEALSKIENWPTLAISAPLRSLLGPTRCCLLPLLHWRPAAPS